jgi:hypothetical protein
VNPVKGTPAKNSIWLAHQWKASPRAAEILHQFFSISARLGMSLSGRTAILSLHKHFDSSACASFAHHGQLTDEHRPSKKAFFWLSEWLQLAG